MEKEKLSAQEDLNIKLRAQHDLGYKDPLDDNYTIARNVLHEDIGLIGETRIPYALDEDTRDTLLAHARQDAAHALCNSVSITKELRTVKRLTIVVIATLAVLILLQLS